MDITGKVLLQLLTKPS